MDIVLLATLESHSTSQVESPLTLSPDRPLPPSPYHAHQSSQLAYHPHHQGPCSLYIYISNHYPSIVKSDGIE